MSKKTCRNETERAAVVSRWHASSDSSLAILLINNHVRFLLQTVTTVHKPHSP